MLIETCDKLAESLYGEYMRACDAVSQPPHRLPPGDTAWTGYYEAIDYRNDCLKRWESAVWIAKMVRK